MSFLKQNTSGDGLERLQTLDGWQGICLTLVHSHRSQELGAPCVPYPHHRNQGPSKGAQGFRPVPTVSFQADTPHLLLSFTDEAGER